MGFNSVFKELMVDYCKQGSEPWGSMNGAEIVSQILTSQRDRTPWIAFIFLDFINKLLETTFILVDTELARYPLRQEKVADTILN